MYSKEVYMKNKSLVLFIILLICAILPGVLYYFMHPAMKMILLIILLICGVLPGVLYLIWPGKGGFAG